MIAVIVLASSLLNPEYVTCNLWKRVEGRDGKVCIYSGPNNTIAYHYAQRSFTECPRQFQCKYMPNSKKKPSISDILDGLKDGFK